MLRSATSYAERQAERKRESEHRAKYDVHRSSIKLLGEKNFN